MIMSGDKGFFGMSDDDFLKLGPSSSGSDEGASAPSSATEEDEQNDNQNNEQNQGNDDAANAGGDDSAAGSSDSDDDADTAASAEGDPEPKGEGKADEGDDDPSDDDVSKAKPPAGKEQGKVADKPGEGDDGKNKSKEGEEGKDKAVTPDPKLDPKDVKNAAPVVRSSKDMKPEELAGFYDQVMKPFKANGREIQLRTPEEAIRLMQMGAGYGRKLQDMQPHLKTLRMLEKNNLLDQEKLGFLIDINSKNPEAIKKLIKDSGIDPLDLNMDDNANYRPTDHSVSDNEVAFAEALKDVSSQPGGRDTIQHINSTWDQKSKEFLWGNPEVLAVIQDQRTNGIYDAITAEIDRKKMLGEIAPTVPFLEAYKIAGDALVASKSLTQPGSEPAPQLTNAAPAQKADQQVGRVLGTRTAAPKSSATNSDKAKAAGSPTNSSRKAKETVNPLDMADDDFLKQFENRL